MDAKVYLESGVAAFQRQSIYLIGMMGSGKSYWGRQLAAASGLPFVDLDELICAFSGRSIPEIFAQDGEAAFRELERMALLQTADQAPVVVATGGGAPCFFDNLDWMLAHGRVIYLETPVEVLADRLASEAAGRPLLGDKKPEDLLEHLRALLEKRRVFYEGANYRVVWESDNERLMQTLLHIISIQAE